MAWRPSLHVQAPETSAAAGDGGHARVCAVRRADDDERLELRALGDRLEGTVADLNLLQVHLRIETGTESRDRRDSLS